MKVLQRCSLGIDVGSVSTNLVLLDENKHLIKKLYLNTQGNPINAIKKGFTLLQKQLDNIDIYAVGTTGSGRQLASILVGADIVKNEITAHATACLAYYPDTQTVIEIGGQDSKIIILRNQTVVDFAMNTVCAAGTGSFLDRQAQRLAIPIDSFGRIALRSKKSTRIAGRCAVFAESDMIHKQQMGHSIEDIFKGLCEALVRNFLSNVAKGKVIKPSILFQGGVAANAGMKQAFEEQLCYNVTVPENYDVMGAIGAAILASNYIVNRKITTNFVGMKNITIQNHNVKSFECQECPNMCEVIQLFADSRLVARWGDRCGKWSSVVAV
ncbi:MAG TPA: 2-hydroxyglutaryl-CoA dehydratase [Thermoanaerobacterales bacterium]|nr:2-hydroxyglutaryl-CoA dehydratase [Thermoanaerobacterales bacterium]